MTEGRDEPGRRSPRLEVQMAAALVGRARRDVKVVELSRTGCLVLCESALDRGAILDMELDMDEALLAVKVRVSQSSLAGGEPAPRPRYLAGLEFLALPARDESRLRRFLEEQRRRKSADASAE
jgi:c-di-GMP-binding flagellar brake protein YcgR